MDRVISFLSNYAHDPNVVRMGLTITVAAGAFLFILGLSYVLVMVFSPARTRLRRVVGRPMRNGPSPAVKIAQRLEPLSPYLLPKKEWERTRVDAQLVHAGFRSPQALIVFYTLKTVLGVVLAAVVVIEAPFFGHLLGRHDSLMQIIIFALALSFLGMTLPNFCLNRLVERRQLKMRRAFPDALDVLVVAVEAGMGLASAIQRVSVELKHSHPELADELGLVNAEIRSGVDRGEALRNMARRTGIEDIQIFAGMIAQTLRYGTSIADTLRVFSSDLRDKRTQQAEERAAKIGTKMIFPLVVCFFPAFFVVAVGPAVLKLIAAFSRL